MGEKLPWILMGGGAAVILVSCWCRVLLDIGRVWFVIFVLVGLAMAIAGKLMHTGGRKSKE